MATTTTSTTTTTTPSSAATSSSQPVLIIGAGIGGLCLAQGLKRHGIPVIVCERDASASSRTQGYRLRINNQGYEALEACLPAETLRLFVDSTAEFRAGFTFLDAENAKPPSTEGSTTRRMPPTGNGDPRKVFSADRLVLRSVLLSGLGDDELRCGMFFKEYVERPDGLVEAIFENGERLCGKMLIGADGAYSRVRQQLAPDSTALLDTDGRAIYGKTLLTPDLEAQLNPAALKTTTLVTNTSPHISLFVEPQRFPQGNPQSLAAHLPDTPDYVYWVLIARSRHFHHSEGGPERQSLQRSSSGELVRVAQEVTQNWDPSVRALFADAKAITCSYIQVTSVHPEIRPWTPCNVTVIGDAIHAMTPAGVGANVALWDAKVLLQELVERGVTTDAVEAYESQMREYAANFVTSSAGAGVKMFGQPTFDEMKPILL